MIPVVLTRNSLKTRITLTTLAIFLISLWSLAFYVSRMLREDIQRLLGEQQVSTASIVAAQINEELDGRSAALDDVAKLVDPLMRDTGTLQVFLEHQAVLQRLFNGGVIVDSIDGTAIAEVPRSTGRIGVNYLDVDTVAAALKDGRSTVGRPVMGRTLKAPVVTMATPIRSVQGKVIGALVGVVNLGKANFMDKIAESRYGNRGGYFVMDLRHDLIVSATDKSRIMQPLPAPGANEMVDKRRRGFLGSAVASNSMGAEVLSSASPIPAAGWLVVAALPTEEAFAPIGAMQRRMLLATVLLTVMAGGLTWWILRRQLAPMSVAAKALASQSNTNQPMRPLPISRQDEIGELVGGFNDLLGTLAKREDDLLAIQRNLREAQNIAHIGSWELDLASNCLTWSQEMYRIFGLPPEEFGADYETFLSTLHPDDRDLVDRAYMVSLEEGGRYDIEYRIIRKSDGEVRWGHARCEHERDANGKVLRSIGTVQDVTQRKDMENVAERERKRVETILRTASDGIHIVDDSGLLVDANRAFLNMLGYDDSAIGKLRVQDWDAVETAADTKARIDELIARHGVAIFETRHRRRDGVILDIEISTTAIEIEGKYHVCAASRDITQRKQVEQQLRIAATAFESQEGIVVTDADKVILRVNRAFTDITGYTAEEVIGQKPSMLKSGRHEAAFYERMWESLGKQGAWQGEIWNRRKNGNVFPEWLTITAVRGDAGEITHYVAALTDITSRKAAEDEIKHLAFYDSLTRLPNRRLLLDRLRQALASAARSGREGALLFIDLDNFKILNDTLGHDIGDILLQQVAKRLSTCIREGDTVARLGGDEFVVMLEDLSENLQEAANQTETVGEKILTILNQPYLLADNEQRSTPSIGATLFDDHHNTVDEVLKRADLAMYQAKAAGRNTLRFFDPEMQAAVTARAALEADLRQGLQQNSFILYYQPQVDEQGRVTGAEALVRLQHPRRGIVYPGDFIPLAEETGLIVPLGQWVLATACSQLVAWATVPELAYLTLAVNVSARQFHHPDFVDQVVAVLDRTGADPYKLKLELTESLLLDAVEDVVAKMAMLKARGVGFALDDFGTGYSSLTYLKRLPLDQLKIDRSFVRDILIDPNDAAIARTIVALAQSMGLGVIAEGVETDEQRDFLARQTCHAFQGYLFGRPMPIEEFELAMHRD